jgi:prepilin-type N-terminal cleavage/methylation domain-containing protein
MRTVPNTAFRNRLESACGQRWNGGVAQVSNLLYRRLPVGWAREIPVSVLSPKCPQVGKPPQVAKPAIQQTGSLRYVRQRAFTLMELLVVIGIIAMLSVVALPAIKNISRSDTMGAASRQLIDDLSYARRMAIRNRATVYVVFLPHDYLSYAGAFAGAEKDRATDLLGMQYHGYAMFTWRRVGEQPGQNNPVYLRDWQTLPQGIFIPLWKYTSGDGSVPAFNTVPIPFPEARSISMPMPCLAFNYLGQLVQFDQNGNPLSAAADEVIPLARGALFIATDPSGKTNLWQAPEVTETPPNNSINNFNHIRVDWMTGRAKLERPEVQ